MWSFCNFEANAWPDSVWASELTSMRPSEGTVPLVVQPQSPGLERVCLDWCRCRMSFWIWNDQFSPWPESVTRSSTSHSGSSSMIMTTRHSAGNRKALGSLNNVLPAWARATPPNEGGCCKRSAERLIIIWNKLKHLDCNNCLKSLCHIYTWLVFYITTSKSKTFEKFQSLCFEVIESSGREQCGNKAY